nr:RNA-directed DNA polymerase, eukaryota [Tanacetum cinerariifolium]
REGETVIMGDFNEVRSEHERFGSIFNYQGASVFNNFISLAGLIDLPLEGYKSMDVNELNGIIRLKKKLQLLKSAIKVWSKEARTRLHVNKINIQHNLSNFEKIIDQGTSNVKIINITTILLKEIQELYASEAIETSQKAKIRWSIEGDENTKYFQAIHLILTGIGDEIYSTVDACQIAQEIWEAIERLQQGESLNIQDKNLSFIAKYFKRIYKPTNNNLKTSSNSRNKNVDTTLRYKNDNQSGQFRNQRTMNVVGASVGLYNVLILCMSILSSFGVDAAKDFKENMLSD